MPPPAQHSQSFAAQRRLAGLSVSDVAQQFGVPEGDVRDWDTGAADVPVHVVRSLDVLQEMAPQGAAMPPPDPAPPKPEAEARPTSELIRSRKRVSDHGEVFTPPWLVERMLDLVKGETERIDSRFLEPACGSGNFLVPILQRKLAAVEAKYGRTAYKRRNFALLALSSIYGIELLPDNIEECRANMLRVLAEYLGIEPDDDTYRAASHMLSLNLIQGDAMTMRAADGSPITVVEWGYIGNGRFNRRDFRLDVLTGMAGLRDELREQQELFASVAHHEVFKPTRDYAPLRIRDMAALDREVRG